VPKPWEKKGGRKEVARKIHRHLIVCEDEKSAADYLRAFKVSEEFAEVVVEGGAGNTASVVEKALKLRDKAINNGTPYAGVWCVFDRDSFPAKNFNRAFDLAKGDDKHDVRIIWANECFELWYLLHFELVVAGLGRESIFAKLAEEKRLGKKYNKSDASVFDLLIAKVETAKKNAKKLLDDYGDKLNPEKDNPSTNVHELVGMLQKLGELGE
jgi:hypothetical protein